MINLRWLICLLCSLAISTTTLAQEKDAAQPKEPIPPPIAIPGAGLAEWFAPDLLRPRVSVRHDVGDGVGFNNGFTYLQGWIPLVQQTGRSVLFSDLRVVNFDNADYWEFNAGGGSRWYNADRDRIFGVNAYYDGRKTATTFFNQIGVGVESLGRYVDFRANGYAVVGPNSSIIGYNNPTFRGSNIVLDTLVENALSGFDFEIGTPIPFLERWDTRAFVGHYHYAAEQGPDVSGVRVRLEANVNHNVSLYFAAQHDAVLRTTVSGGIAMNFGGRKVCREQRGTVDRLDARVVRDVNIVSYSPQPVEANKVTALDPTTGQPIVVRPAHSAAAAGGDGTVENPVQDLKQLQTVSTPNDILFLHANSTFVDPKLTLQNGQRLLGEGVNHTFTSTTGAFLLPRATTGKTLPLLSVSSNNVTAVTLAQDNEVSGLSFEAPAPTPVDLVFIAAAILNSNSFTINRNTFSGGQTGIALTNTTGIGLISENTFRTESVGVNIVATGSLKLLIEKNQFLSGQSGVGVSQSSGSFVLGIRANEFRTTTSVTDLVSGGTQTLLLQQNVGVGAYNLTQSLLGTFNIENVLYTNTPQPTTSGTINFVAPGSAGFP